MNPAHVHNYAKSLPRRGKTDAIDAHVLLHFGIERTLPAWTPPPAVYHELRQRLTARDTLMTMRQQARNHLHALSQWPVRIESVQEHFTQTIAELDTRIAALEREIGRLLVPFLEAGFPISRRWAARVLGVCR